jgi:hypothetical protein
MIDEDTGYVTPLIEPYPSPLQKAIGTMQLKDILTDRSVAEFLDDELVVTNENGAKQSEIWGRWDLLPARAIEEVARVMSVGAKKYGEENWRGLSVAEIHNHTIRHAVNFNRTNELEDLSHAACRALMALEIYLEAQDE